MYFAADCLQADRNVLFVHHNREVLRIARRQLRGLLSNDALVNKRFRRRCCSGQSDIRKLITEHASVVAVLGFLHHVSDPKAALASWRDTRRPLVIVDSTTELLQEMILRHARLRKICDEHFVCRDEASRVGFNTQQDIERLLMEGQYQPPDSFEYVVSCDCEEGQCPHAGKLVWKAVWQGA